MSMLKKLGMIGLSIVVFNLTFTAPVKSANNKGKWGSDDQIGTLNYITPQVRTNAAKLVRSGKVFNVAIDLKKDTPSYPGRVFQHSFSLILPGLSSDGGGIGFSDDLIIMHQQYSTQWDGFPHVGYDGKLYNDVPSSVVTTMGTQKHSIHLWADKIVTRGVLLDLAKYKDQEFLEKGYIITSEDLQGAAKMEGVEINSGDCLLIRTGWIAQLLKQRWPMREKWGEYNEVLEFGEPGVGYDAAQWLHKKEVACIAVDNIGVEPFPFDPIAIEKLLPKDPKIYPMHVEFLVNMGMPIGELFDFEVLARDCAEDGQYDFMFVATPLRIVGGAGSPLSPVAIK